MSLSNLPDELLLFLIRDLLNDRDSYSLSTVNKKLWAVDTRPSKHHFVLRKSINALQLRSVVSLCIKEEQYQQALIKHIFKYASNLSRVFFQSERVKFRLAELFMVAERECTFVVPATAYNTFMAAIEESENNHITVEILDSQPDTMRTPEEIRNRLKILKEVEKAKYARVNGFRLLFKDRLDHIIPSFVSSLFNPNEFRLYKDAHSNQKVDTAERADEMVAFPSRFLETVVVIANHRFFVASLYVFVHERNVDDCADFSKVGPQKDAVTFIRKKTRTGRDIFELTIRFSCIKLLCTSGFFGHVNEPKMQAFFGSPISTLPQAITESYQTVSSNDLFVNSKGKRADSFYYFKIK